MWNLLARSTGVNLMKLVFEHLLYDDISELKCLNSDIKPMELVSFAKSQNNNGSICFLDTQRFGGQFFLLCDR